MTLTDLCQELKNWFCNEDSDIHEGTYTVENGKLSLPFLLNGQYFRIKGSVFNDGVQKYDENLELQDETFVGTVWAMKIPQPVLDLFSEIEAWNEKNAEAVSSPYQSESWGGYSCSLKSGSGDTGALSWKSVFASSLNRWRKL